MYADKAIFLNSNQKKRFDEMINEKFEVVDRYLSNRNCDVNLYVSGSLARKEPCVELSDSGVKLTSDIDYVLLAKTLEDCRQFTYITKEVNDLCPDVQNSFVVIDEAKLPGLKSFFARDLSLLMDHPIRAGFSLMEPPKYCVDSANCIESISTQLACYILHPDFTKDKSGNKFFRKSDYHWIKAILECTRLPYIDQGVIAYNDIVHLNYVDELQSAISREELLTIIKSRELTETCPLDRRLIYKYVHDLLMYSFGVTKETDMQKLVYEQSTDEIKCFQYAVISLFLYSYSKDNSWLYTFGDIIDGLSFVSAPLISQIKNNLHTFISTSNEQIMERILVAFREIRNTYVGLLHHINTKEDVFSDVQ